MDTIIDSTGRRRAAGCLPRVSRPGDGTFRVFGTDGTPPLIDRADWDKYPEPLHESLIWHIIDQANQGSCCGSMGAGIIMLLRAILGLKRVVLSQASLYGQGNGGRDQGMAIDTCLRIAMEVGACPTSVIDQYDWRGYWDGSWPENWRQVAKRYRIAEAWDCTSIEHVVSANKHGFPVAYGARGHAVFRIGRNRDVNSWGPDWSGNGIGKWVDEDVLDREIRSYGAWALRLVTDPAEDGDLPG